MKRASVSVIFAGMHFRWGLRVVTGPVFHADQRGMPTVPGNRAVAAGNDAFITRHCKGEDLNIWKTRGGLYRNFC